MKNINYYFLLLLVACTSLSTVQAQIFPRDSFEITGRLLATSGHPMPNVVVTLVGPAQIWVDTTGVDGLYAFREVPEKEDYYLQFAKEGAPENGLGANDLLLLQKHLLGFVTLSPFSLFAGDLNGGAMPGVSTFDVVLIARILLGLNADISTPNWRFIYAYTDYAADNPWEPIGIHGFYLDDFPIHQLKGHLQNIDFVGLKTGDIDQTANPFE